MRRPALPRELNFHYESFPFAPTGTATQPLESVIESLLPSMARATELCETLLEHLTWMFSIVSRQYLIGELIPAVYTQNRIHGQMYGPHDLALLLIALGIGVFVDLNLPPYHEEAEYYYRLARSVVSLQSVLTRPSIATIKCLHLMSIYNGMSGNASNLEDSYRLLNLAGHVALGVGYDPFSWDPSLMGIGGKEAYDRRAYFWNLVQPILWQSLLTDHPPPIMAMFISCRMLSAEEEETHEQSGVPLGSGAWSCQFIMECLFPVTEAMLASNPPTYQNVLELDRRIRAFNIPLSSPLDSASSEMQHFVRSHFSALTLMFLHRSYFTRALADNPTNPLNSAHSQSFSTTYECACVILDSTRDQYDRQPDLVPRVWRIWTNALSAAVIIGTVAMHNLNATLKPSPLEKLEHACTLFRSAAKASSPASRALVSTLLLIMIIPEDRS
ncbi:hypothetical protein PILCRDRAFT_74553 [Piloderma croceum F 1598]|uniref:Transcription factor domain-containing protein n=1 Tax=Piloderma croceum (strain F 1598) TaxID=765440 RepID=A0A0C3BPJ1_PILCF|nr:hypothetical protein PILCRDRAFT_74553 [Piloderma croceum F 1598]